MQSDYQFEIIRAMQDPGFYPHPVKAVSLQETHISRILLTGDFVYKIKKPVNLGFLNRLTWVFLILPLWKSAAISATRKSSSIED